MTASRYVAFLPELIMLAGALVLFFITLGEKRAKIARTAAIWVAVAAVAAALLSLNQNSTLFFNAYRVDLFSQVLKLVFASGFLLILMMSGALPDIREEVKPEYYLFLTISVSGLMMLVSSVDLITIVVALETSSFPLYLMVPMRRERAGQRSQMESAIKYMMFGVAANGIMFFGMSYLVGLTGTTMVPAMISQLSASSMSSIAIAGLAMALAGFYYKLALFPFHFWTPDVYQGASNETAGVIASLPKIGAVAVLVRLTAMADPANRVFPVLLAILALSSMFYGNLIALMQRDFKRLLGFSGIAHAGYALVGFVALDPRGSSAAVYYIIGYFFMVLACFVVICKVSRDGTNVGIEELAGLHRRAPLLALTLGIAVFGLAGIPPFVGFMGKFALISAALAKGYTLLVILTMVNAAIAAYYYLAVVREAWFKDPASGAGPIRLDFTTRSLCILLIIGIVGLGVAPAFVINNISKSVAQMNPHATTPAAALVSAPEGSVR